MRMYKHPDISLSETRFVMESRIATNLFDLELKQMDCSVSKDGRQLSLNTHIDCNGEKLCLQYGKGSFLKDKSLAGHFTLQFKHGQ